MQLGVLPNKAALLETSGPKLAVSGISELEKLLQKGMDAGGGSCVFIDEAYALNPKQDRTGGQVLDFMLPHAEKLDGKYGKVVFVLAGYSKDMEKLFEHNQGLPSRFPRHFVFEDYTEAELLSIFQSHLDHPGGVRASESNTKNNNAKPPQDKPLAGVDVTQAPLYNSNNNTNAYSDRGFPRYYGMRGNNSMTTTSTRDGTSRTKDQWGHAWKYDAQAHTWTDEFENQSGYGPADASRPLGSAHNPVHRTGADGRTLTPWVYDANRDVWHPQSDAAAAVDTYPGEPRRPAHVSCVPFTLSDPKWGRVAMRRLARMRGSVGFGNARAVKNVFDNALRRQAARITRDRERGLRPDIHELVREDVLGPRADEEALSRCHPLQELMQMEGLHKVKEAVRSLLRLVVDNSSREEQEKPLNEVVLNRIFLGNPGTGKTTVAKLYGAILCDFGLLSKGDVVFKVASDFKGAFMRACVCVCMFVVVCLERFLVCVCACMHTYIHTHIQEMSSAHLNAPCATF